MADANAAVLESLRRYVLDPEVIEAAICQAIDTLTREDDGAGRAHEQALRELRDVERELERYVAALGAGGDVPALVAALRTREDRRRELLAAVADTRRRNAAREFDVEAVEGELRGLVQNFQVTLSSQAPDARQMLRQLLKTPLTMRPHHDERFYEFRGQAYLGDVLVGRILPTNVGGVPNTTQPAVYGRDTVGNVPSGTQPTVSHGIAAGVTGAP